MSAVLLVGAGRMGSALLTGWLKKSGPITVVEPKPSAEIKALAKKKKIALVAAPSLAAGKKFSACVVAINSAPVAIMIRKQVPN